MHLIDLEVVSLADSQTPFFSVKNLPIMCLIAFALNKHPKYPLILAANRDEFYDRPTSVVGFWQDQSDILGGRDLKAGGTWMGLTRSGRFAAVTNYRDIANIRENAKSRGDLTKDFLVGVNPDDYMNRVSREAGDYNGFNLLTYEDGQMMHFSNYENKVNKLEPGVYGLSNALLDTPWPKVAKLKATFEKVIASSFTEKDLYSILLDSEKAVDNQLPDTGVPPEWEKELSAICIRTENYGTCCSTIIMIDQDKNVIFSEKSYPVGNRRNETRTFKFRMI
ncbi:MAG: NRDE family protein [Cyclobacteriaceae bacterium]|nr:NRDE family protein [Cyclobacteriaceae bacterium HetDA_MAG_MS6]